jgi:hypothetical protein
MHISVVPLLYFTHITFRSAVKCRELWQTTLKWTADCQALGRNTCGQVRHGVIRSQIDTSVCGNPQYGYSIRGNPRYTVERGA